MQANQQVYARRQKQHSGKATSVPKLLNIRKEINYRLDYFVLIFNAGLGLMRF